VLTPPGDLQTAALAQQNEQLKAEPHGLIGGMLRKRGDLPAALESYRAKLAIMEHLAEIDPANLNEMGEGVAQSRRAVRAQGGADTLGGAYACNASFLGTVPATDEWIAQDG
jgi:hypothetical protein